jgi:hypothetical protein
VCPGCNKHKAPVKFSRHHTCWDCRKNSTTEATSTPPAPPRERSKRPYDQLGPTQRWNRRKLAREALADIGVPLAALCDHRTTPAAVLGLSTADRRKIRTVDELCIAGEKQIVACKIALAQTHGTRTAAFSFPRAGAQEKVAVGAYVCDPLLLLRTVAAQSPFLSVGGDKGGGFTKLGVTYSAQGIQHFLPLLVFEGDDNYDDLHALRTADVTKFIGQSETYKNIFSVLQYIITQYHAFLNGDWPFISCMLQHKGHAANYPCPICIIPKEKLLSSAAYRRPVDGNSLHPVNDAFLSIAPERIVPTPLHLYLGINNRIIFDAFKELIGEQQLAKIIATVKSKHSAGCGGLSDLYQLNGPEISRWIRRGRAQEVALIASAVFNASQAVEARVSRMAEWMKKLEHYLLKGCVWDPVELFKFRGLLDEIYASWRKTTGDHAFPKLHMLRHAVEFAERFHILGAASEAQIESFHFHFNTLYHKQHTN